MKNIFTTAFVLLCFNFTFAQGAFTEKQENGSAKNNQISNAQLESSAANFKAISQKYQTNIKRDFSFENYTNLKKIEVNAAEIKGWKALVNEDGMNYFLSLNEAIALNIGDELKTENQILDFLNDNAAILKIENPAEELTLHSYNYDAKGNVHLKFQQEFNGLKVYASQIVVHANSNEIFAINGRYNKTPKIENWIPEISEQLAVNKAIEDLEKFTKILDYPNNDLVNQLVLHPDPIAETIIYFTENKQAKLCYQIHFSPNIKEHWTYIIDANTNEIYEKYNDVCSAVGPEIGNGQDLFGVNRSFNVWEESGTYFMIDGSRPNFNLSQSQMPDEPVGAIVTLDLGNNDVDQFGNWVNQLDHITSNNNSWNSPTSVSAHYNAGLCYEYFSNTFGRNAIDGNGGTIWSIINVTDGGSQMDNAFWNGIAMFYGNGAQVFNELPKALDVAAHEMSHGVTQNTANLIYQGQSGALNESFSDVFGAMVDRDDWQMGEDITNPNIIASGALRDVQNPNNGVSNGQNGWQPKSMSEYINTTQDNGGVHINSGIPNRAFYLFATAVGKDIAEEVYYNALTSYLTQNSQFVDCRASIIQSALDLHNQNIADEAAAAFDAVGIVGAGSTGGSSGGNTTTAGGDLPPLVGDEFILVADQYIGNETSENFYKVGGAGYAQITTSEAFPKPSVTDDGALAYYVKTDNKVYVVDLTAADPSTTEQEVLSDPIWRKCAISKDGTKLAALTTNFDNKIIVFDANGYQEYTLINPSTSSDGTAAGAPEYADAIEFSPSGEYLMYDALNLVSGTGGSQVSTWDIGLLRVYDNAAASFGDGSILKLFPPQPSTISIGNATFSKNSPYIIAFDLLDESVNGIFVMAANLQSGESSAVAQTNGVVGYPSYAPADNGIAYSDENTGYFFSRSVDVIQVAADKISPVGTAQSIIASDIAWPVWYIEGQRDWQMPQAEFSANTTEGPASLTVNFTDQSTNSPTQWNWTFENGNPSTSTDANPIVTWDTPGMYDVTLTVTNPVGNNTESKTQYINVGDPVSTEEIYSEDFDLKINPKPLNEIGMIEFYIPNYDKFSLSIYNLKGDLIHTVLSANAENGADKISLDAKHLAAGIYFLKLEQENISISKRFIKN